MHYREIIMNFPVIPCVMYRMFGIYCPGCGGTRAVIALLKGQWLKSLWYHPLVLYIFILFTGFLLSHTLERLHICKIKGWKFHEWYLYGALAILLINWIGKNVLLLCFRITL